jgi:hypothetical protein
LRSPERFPDFGLQPPASVSGQFGRRRLSCADKREYLTGKAYVGLQTLKLGLQVRLPGDKGVQLGALSLSRLPRDDLHG